MVEIAAVAIGWTAPALAAQACQGQDLLARMAATAPADYADIERDARAMPFGEGRLFRITHAELPPSFLFGTLHVVDPRLAELSPAEREALRSAKTAVLETLDLDGRSAPSLAEGPFAATGAERASHLLAPDEFRQLQKLVALRGFPVALADAVRAPVLALMLDLPGCALHRKNGPSFADAQVLAAARANGIPVVGLEAVSEQLSIADGLPLAAQSALLSAVLAQSREAESVIETSVDLYSQGKTGLLLAWTRSPRPIPGVSGADIPVAFLDRIVTDRTRRMRDRIIPLLQRGAAFIAVGTAHIPGSAGLGALLVEAGYQVERIE